MRRGRGEERWLVASILIYPFSCTTASATLPLDVAPSLSQTPPCLFRANIVVQCESWWNLAKQFASRSPPLHLLSSSVQRSLMKALVLGGFAHMDSDTKQQYWAEVMSAQSCVVKNIRAEGSFTKKWAHPCPDNQRLQPLIKNIMKTYT